MRSDKEVRLNFTKFAYAIYSVPFVHDQVKKSLTKEGSKTVPQILGISLVISVRKYVPLKVGLTLDNKLFFA